MLQVLSVMDYLFWNNHRIRGVALGDDQEAKRNA
jgi:hypothetical protein